MSDIYEVVAVVSQKLLSEFVYQLFDKLKLFRSDFVSQRVNRKPLCRCLGYLFGVDWVADCMLLEVV